MNDQPPSGQTTGTSGDGTRLASIIKQNIDTIAAYHRSVDEQRSPLDRLADVITQISGRMSFVFFHVVWFGTWIVYNLGIFGNQPFDSFPFGLLTMIVSLEAIFLSTFVLISQNHMIAESDRRAELDLQIDLLAEYEMSRVLKMLDAIQDKLGIENDGDTELQDLEQQVHPEDVLAEIGRIQEQMKR